MLYELATGLRLPYAAMQNEKINLFKMSLKVLNTNPPQLPPNRYSEGMYDFLKRWYIFNIIQFGGGLGEEMGF